MAKYNRQIKKVRDKIPAYRSLINPETAERIYTDIIRIIIVEKKFLDPNYTHKQLAKDLGTNTRYLSAVMQTRLNASFSKYVCAERIKYACTLFTDKRYRDLTMDEIGKLCGFNNRQSFYANFTYFMANTPAEYRKKFCK